MISKIKIFPARLFLFVFVALAAVSCGDKDCDVCDPRTRTFFIYMAASNSLGARTSDFDTQNIDLLVAGATRANIGRNKIVVYHAAKRSSQPAPRLLLIQAGKDGKGVMTVLKEYEAHNSATVEALSTAIADMQEYAPADSYALDIWSHGTGWLPYTASSYMVGPVNRWGQQQGLLRKMTAPDSSQRFQTKAIIQDTRYPAATQWLSVADISAAVPDHLFEFILFDACYMGQIEVAYELRNDTKYVVASSTEVLADGMPYDRILKDVFATTPNLTSLCAKFYDYYNVRTGMDRSATIAYYDCSKLEALATKMREVASTRRTEIANFSLSTVQFLDGYNKHTMFDLEDFIAKLAPAELASVRALITAAIPYATTTPEAYTDPGGGTTYPINTYCGASVYIPVSAYADINPAYYATAWGARVYGD